MEKISDHIAKSKTNNAKKALLISYIPRNDSGLIVHFDETYKIAIIIRFTKNKIGIVFRNKEIFIIFCTRIFEKKMV